MSGHLVTSIIEGTIAYIGIHGLVYLLKQLVNSTERTVAIWTHHQKRAAGVGHTAPTVLGCSEEKCAAL
jgi:uncharacterized protein (DUF1015 family)